MPITLIRQIIDNLVNEALYHGQVSTDLTIDGQVSLDIVAFKDRLEQRLISAAEGGGGTPTLDAVIAAGGTLTEDRNIDLAGKDLAFNNGEDQIMSINSEVVNFRKRVRATELQTFADNAAALVGGLDNGDFYIRTAHGLDIVTD